MPNSEFLETYPLYRKFEPESNFLSRLLDLPKPAINMICLSTACNDGQTRTFNMIYDYYFQVKEVVLGRFISINNTAGQVVNAVYECNSCKSYKRTFSLYFDSNLSYVMKIGQYPAWDIRVKKDLEKMFGENSRLYKNGLICESQGYGIGSFAYYRRIIEDVIDKLLSEIHEIIQGEKEKAEYEEALQKVKESKDASRKIDLVKHLLPNILQPDGHNPLITIYDNLSTGLHSSSDEECLEISESLRVSLEFLVHKIYENKVSDKKYTEAIKKLDAKKQEAVKKPLS